MIIAQTNKRGKFFCDGPHLPTFVVVVLVEPRKHRQFNHLCQNAAGIDGGEFFLESTAGSGRPGTAIGKERPIAVCRTGTDTQRNAAGIGCVDADSADGGSQWSPKVTYKPSFYLGEQQYVDADHKK